MHDAALARRLVEIVLAHAGGARVRVVRGWVADAETLSAETLALHFAAHAAGTPAAGARLELRVVQIDPLARGGVGVDDIEVEA